jgi:hypothetical protein
LARFTEGRKRGVPTTDGHLLKKMQEVSWVYIFVFLGQGAKS